MMRALGRLGTLALDYRYAASRQLRSLLPAHPPAAYRTGDKVPVVLLPGVYETWEFLRPIARRLHADGHPVHVVHALGVNRGGVAEMAALARDYLDRAGLRDLVIVAHSKGGLIGKHLMISPGGGSVRRLVAVATPFAGSVYANYLPVRSLRIFRPGDHSIITLGTNLDANSRIASLYPAYDPHIPGGSYLAGAQNIELPLAGHFRILAHPDLLDEVARQVAAASGE